MKRIDIKEFREKGYLQEVNRRFFHPLGLALEVVIDDEGNESLGGIWDDRDDPEGFHYDYKNKPEKQEEFRRKKVFVDQEFAKRKDERIKNIGFEIENIE